MVNLVHQTARLCQGAQRTIPLLLPLLRCKEMNWYPWEKVQVDIPSYDVEDGNGQITENGTYLIPVVWNKRY